MKKLLLFLLSASLLNAQQTGIAAADATKTAKEWPNWVFAATTAVTATAGILIVSFHGGKDSPSH